MGQRLGRIRPYPIHSLDYPVKDMHVMGSCMCANEHRRATHGAHWSGPQWHDESVGTLETGQSIAKSLYGGLPFAREFLRFDGQIVCSFMSGVIAADIALLAPMESADSLLICCSSCLPMRFDQVW